MSFFEEEITIALKNLRNKLVEDKNEWSKRLGFETKYDESEYSILAGIKYTKVVARQGGVWGFIMNVDDNKFKKGDILKARNWESPARNFARGNIFNIEKLPRNIWVGA